MQKPDIVPGSFSFRLSCYEQFGWTPDDVMRCPASEAALLSVYFEELSLKQQEDQAAARKQSSSSSPNTADMDTDSEIGGDDEIDWFEAQKAGTP